MLRSRWSPVILGALLIVSLGFNAGVGATYGVRGYHKLWGGGPHEHERRKAAFLEKLALSDEQKEQFEQARESLMTEIDGHRTQLDAEHQALVDLMTADETDREAVAAQVDAISSIRSAMQKTLVTHFLDQRDRLDGDQRATFDEAIEHVFAHGGPGMGIGHGHGFGKGAGAHRRGRPCNDEERPAAPGQDE